MQCQNTIAIIPGQLAAVVGAGSSGIAAAKLLSHLGLKVRLLEKNESFQAPEIAKKLNWEIVLGEHTTEHFMDVSLVVPSPGMPVAKLLPILPEKIKNLIIGEMELAFMQVDEPIIAITGTSGKTTTASICADMLEAGGLKVFLGGNIGTPLSEYVLSGKKADVLVLEISSFQLQTCRTFRPKVGMLLNISENHLDYHTDMAEYTDAKFSLFNCQTTDDYAIFPADMKNDANIKAVQSKKVFFKAVNDFKSTALLGEHNQLNLAAAWEAAKIFGVSLPAAQQAAREFESIEHRLEILGEKDGILFINDSKSTTVDSLRVALTAMERPVLLLAGGVFKGGDLASLLPLIKEKVKAVGLFGSSREIFESSWSKHVPTSWSENLEQACIKLNSIAKPGDVMLLSPATASFDLYANYKKRGDDFRRIWEIMK